MSKKLSRRVETYGAPVPPDLELSSISQPAKFASYSAECDSFFTRSRSFDGSYPVFPAQGLAPLSSFNDSYPVFPTQDLSLPSSFNGNYPGPEVDDVVVVSTADDSEELSGAVDSVADSDRSANADEAQSAEVQSASDASSPNTSGFECANPQVDEADSSPSAQDRDIAAAGQIEATE